MLLVYELQLPGNTDKPKTHFSRAAGTIAGLGGFFSETWSSWKNTNLEMAFISKLIIY